MSHTDAARTYLMERQRAEGLTSRAMAKQLGMSEANWCHVRAGRRALASVQILRACVLYRDLHDLLFGKEAQAS
jgi:hypothetical protein